MAKRKRKVRWVEKEVWFCPVCRTYVKVEGTCPYHPNQIDYGSCVVTVEEPI